MSARRGIAGVALLVIAVIIILAGYWNLPDAQTCAVINQMQQQWCRSSPGSGTWIWAAVVGCLGVLCFAPAIIKWLTGK